ncbi:MarR family winged helix-turn-helix transcriptional regulator [Enterococcus hermanniensis]|uniref:Transcriptional regulator, MarR family n=1 Tax=Enterococcus hermanniensis TaxID=249189 RepID=A0A1L8TRQ0_9ENTE|nr:MarR family transcriptional regulator [Enterococcus hermanniensis]OJG46960.1 transcriptional regulator, MarR family [Enterococcus hermanniensis]
MKNVGREIKRAVNQMDKAMDAYARSFDLTGVQLSIIHMLSERKQQNVLQRDIEQEFNIQRSTATVILQRMEKKGLIQRKKANQDARQKQVMLTPTALAFEKSAAEYIDGQQALIEQRFTEQQRKDFEAILAFFIEQNS